MTSGTAGASVKGSNPRLRCSALALSLRSSSVPVRTTEKGSSACVIPWMLASRACGPRKDSTLPRFSRTRVRNCCNLCGWLLASTTSASRAGGIGSCAALYSPCKAALASSARDMAWTYLSQTCSMIRPSCCAYPCASARGNGGPAGLSFIVVLAAKEPQASTMLR